MDERPVSADNSPLVDPGSLVATGPLVDPGPLVDAGPLLAVTFQRNVNRKEKYLESEPKALGITQIVLSIFLMSCIGMFLSKDLSQLESSVIFFISSVLVVIAGGVAIAAQKLHMPTLRACFAMQLLSTVASVINIICTLIQMEYSRFYCWTPAGHNGTEYCHSMEVAQSHFLAGAMLMEVTLLAVSVTLAVYCCKVLNCCGPAPKMPVITVQTAAVPQ